MYDLSGSTGSRFTVVLAVAVAEMTRPGGLLGSPPGAVIEMMLVQVTLLVAL